MEYRCKFQVYGRISLFASTKCRECEYDLLKNTQCKEYTPVEIKEFNWREIGRLERGIIKDESIGFIRNL